MVSVEIARCKTTGVHFLLRPHGWLFCTNYWIDTLLVCGLVSFFFWGYSCTLNFSVDTVSTLAVDLFVFDHCMQFKSFKELLNVFLVSLEIITVDQCHYV